MGSEEDLTSSQRAGPYMDIKHSSQEIASEAEGA